MLSDSFVFISAELHMDVIIGGIPSKITGKITILTTSHYLRMVKSEYEYLDKYISEKQAGQTIGSNALAVISFLN